MGQAISVGASRASAILTASYVAGNTIPCVGARQVVFYCTYTRHASATANEVQVKIEFSPDGGTTWFQQAQLDPGTISAGSDVSGVLQRVNLKYNDTSSSAELFCISVPTLGASAVRMQAKESAGGDITNLGTFAATYALVVV